MKLSIGLLTCICLLSGVAFANTEDERIAAEQLQRKKDEAFRQSLAMMTGERVDADNEQISTVVDVFAAWNPEMSPASLRAVFEERVRQQGIRDGLLRPVVILMDAATMTDSREVLQALAPVVYSIDPVTGRKLIERLGLDAGSSHWQDVMGGLSAMKIDTLSKIKSKYGDGIRESSKMPSLIGDLRRLDVSGVTAALFGPGSRIHVLTGFERDTGLQHLQSKSAIFGMNSAEIVKCFNRCSGQATTTAAAVGTIYATSSGLVGLAGGPGLALSSAATGGLIGSALGLAHGYHECSARSCRGDTVTPSLEAQKSPAPVSPTVDKIPESPPTPTTPSSPKSDEPKPGKDPAQSGGASEPCSKSAKSCDARVNPDDDRNAGSPTPKDTGTRMIGEGVKDPRPARAAWEIQKLAPYVNPVRPDSAREFIRGGKL